MDSSQRTIVVRKHGNKFEVICAWVTPIVDYPTFYVSANQPLRDAFRKTGEGLYEFIPPDGWYALIKTCDGKIAIKKVHDVQPENYISNKKDKVDRGDTTIKEYFDRLKRLS